VTKLRGGAAAAQLGAMLQEAIRCHQDGRTARAERLYRDILAIDPNNLDATHLTGVLAAQRQDYAKAADYIGRAAKMAPHLAPIRANLGRAYAKLDRIEEALAAFEEAVRLAPGLADAWNDLGNAQRDLGRVEQAMKSFERAVNLAPQMAEPWANAADALVDLGEPMQAQNALAKALSLVPNFPEALHIRGRLALSQGDPGAALADVDAALALRPQFAAALATKARALRALGREDEAGQAGAAAMALDPKQIDRLLTRAGTAAGQALSQTAIGYCDEALALNARLVAAHAMRAVELMLLKRMDESAAAAQAGLAIDADDALSLYVEAQLALQTCDWDGQDRTLAMLRQCVAEHRMSLEVSAFTFMTLDTGPDEQLACARMSSRELQDAIAEEGRTDPPPPARRRVRGDKIRLGYVSGDYNLHATAWLMAGLIEAHDRSRFEVIGFSSGPPIYDAMRERLAKSFDRFVDIREMTDEAAFEAMREAGIDIAVDLKGYTQNHRAGVMARRPAPVQVSFLGYPGTMGADFIDYLIADPVLIGPGEEAFYSEKIVRLPDTYQVNTPRPVGPAPAGRAEQGLPEKGVVFASFNNSYKITRPVFGVWMRLLKATPGSVLWLLGDNAAAVETLKREAAARDIDPGRLVFAERLPQAEHLARQALADLFLDTVPVNAHTTASDALWAGLPVVTCKGRAFIGRVAASVLTAADMPELITETLEGYEALALSLARDPDRVAALKARLMSGRAKSRLFDTARFTRHLEAAYEVMQERAAAGLAPEAIDIPGAG
jgi:predicted O-linked N-acetylglucosamine transferase (SPINDLY family)